METNDQSHLDKSDIVKETEMELEALIKEKINEHLDAVENIATCIDIGYSDFEAEKWCKLIYFPSPLNLSQRIMWWISLESLEASLDAQILDADSLEIERCTYQRCGYTFLDIHSHYWQYHPEFIKPNTKMANHTTGTATETGFQKMTMKQIESNPMEGTEYADMGKPRGKKGSDSTRPAKDGINDIPGSEIYEKDNTEIQDGETRRLKEKESTEITEPSRKQAFVTNCISGSDKSIPDDTKGGDDKAKEKEPADITILPREHSPKCKSDSKVSDPEHDEEDDKEAQDDKNE